MACGEDAQHEADQQHRQPLRQSAPERRDIRSRRGLAPGREHQLVLALGDVDPDGPDCRRAVVVFCELGPEAPNPDPDGGIDPGIVVVGLPEGLDPNRVFLDGLGALGDGPAAEVFEQRPEVGLFLDEPRRQHGVERCLFLFAREVVGGGHSLEMDDNTPRQPGSIP